PLSEEDIELMVWLDYNFDFPIKTVGEDDKFLIKYIKKKPMLYLPTYHWFTFLNKNKTGIIDFDLIELFEKCKGLINLKDYHIRSIELGNEYSKNTKVKTKLFKVDFNFIKKQEFKINIKHKRLS
ncbi:MAG TPA: hypothetical protein VI790_01855, partial [Candidatus Nanoarchaeia archaeon]|nr:hypothetical protein [Candidatus Nanoarchaeia archaeon]